MNEDAKQKEDSSQPPALKQVGDKGVAGVEPTSTTDRDQPSALGGKTATRSAVDPKEKEDERST